MVSLRSKAFTLPFAGTCPFCRRLVPQNEQAAYEGSCEDCWVDRHPWFPSTSGILWNRRDGCGESYNIPMNLAAMRAAVAGPKWKRSEPRHQPRKPKTQVSFYEQTNFDFTSTEPPAEPAD